MYIKILINSNPFYTSSASANRWLTLIEGLNNLGVDIQLLIVGNYQSKAEKEKFSSVSNINGVEIKYLTSKLVVGLWQRRYYSYIGKYIQNLRIKKKVEKELLNFTGIVWPENDIVIWKTIRSLKNKPFKVISEMSEFLDIHHFNKGNVLQRMAGDAKQKYFENTFFKTLDGLVLMTKTLFEHYKNFDAHPPLLHLPMTVDFDRFNNVSKNPSEFIKPYIVFVGVMNDAKDGVNILIDSFQKISKNYPKLTLYLVGPWNYDTPTHLESIRKYNLEERIKWVGEYPRETIPSIICNAQLLVLPRPDSKQAQGGFPTKLGEYLATGNPVCATTVGEIPNYLTHNESIYFAKPGSVNSFVNVMSLALEDPIKAKEIGLKGKKVAETSFNKSTQSQKLYEFLNQLQNENQKQNTPHHRRHRFLRKCCIKSLFRHRSLLRNSHIFS